MDVRALFDLTGKQALVTGGVRGVGYMCAAGLLDAGASVTVTSRNAEAADTACEELAKLGTCAGLVADVSTDEGIERLAEAIHREHDQLHILVNNAGASWGDTFDSYPRRAWDKVLPLNLLAPFYLSQALAGMLEESARPDAPARIVNIGSVDGHAVGPFDNFAYATSKAALHQLTRVLAVELAPRGIIVNCLAVGPVPTRMTAALLDAAGEDLIAANPLGRLGNADDIAGAVVFLTARASAYLTGSILPLDGGFTIPSWGNLARDPLRRTLAT